MKVDKVCFKITLAINQSQLPKSPRSGTQKTFTKLEAGIQLQCGSKL